MKLPSLFLLAAMASASVVIIPGGGIPKPFNGGAKVTSEDAFFRQSAPGEFFNNSAKLIMTSYSATNLSSSSADLYPSGDSFIRGAIQAWGEHLHLVIRPDEVWFTILVQLNFYMLSHAEEVRPLFVNHTGQQEIYLKDFNLYDLLLRFQTEIQARVNTPWLLDWLTPSFSTTTESDRMTANILMMGLTQAYFKYVGKLVCGLPSVTLLGTQADWQMLLSKLDRLPDFGAEPAAYRKRLLPILSRIVESFSSPDSPETRKFWNQIVSAQATHICGLPPVWISGWITGFYYWSDRGGPFARVRPEDEASALLTLDGVAYPKLDLTIVPVGYARAPLILKEFQGMDEFPAFVAAGGFGKEVRGGRPPEGYVEALKRVGEEGDKRLVGEGVEHGVLRPLSGWMVYGPVDYEVKRPSWGLKEEEEELAGILEGVVRGMGGGETCGLLDGP